MAKPDTRKPTLEELQNLVPLRQFPGKYLHALASHCSVLILPKKAHLSQPDSHLNWMLFLIKGKITLKEADGEILEFGHREARAGFPLTPEGRGRLDVKCLSNCEFMRIPLHPYRTLRQRYNEKLKLEAEAPKAELSEEELLQERILTDFQEAIKNGRLNLPSMPDLATRIADHVDSPKSTSESISRIVQADPAIAARLVQVANSAALGARKPVKTCKDAVTRLGHSGTRELVTSFVLKGLFRSRSPLIRQRMQTLWEHSRMVAAINHVLARHIPGFDPARALLIGLVHDIGLIPLLTHAETYAGLVDDAEKFDHILDKLRGPVGAITLEQWGFSKEFSKAALEAEDWLRDPSEHADYTDLLIVAQLHVYLGSPRMTELPPIDQTPAFNKLGLMELTPRASLKILEKAKEEVQALQRMLS